MSCRPSGLPDAADLKVRTTFCNALLASPSTRSSKLELETLTGLASRFGAFVAERHPFALGDASLRSRRSPAAATRRARPPSTRFVPRCGASSPAGWSRAPLPPDLPDTTPRTSAHDPPRAGARGAARRVRRLPAPRGDRSVADAGRAPRDPARHGADARHRQPPEGVLHERRGPLRPHGVSGQGLPIARTGSDLRGGHPPAPRRGVSRRRRRLERRRRRAGDSRSRRRARDAAGAGDGAHGAERADGQGRRAARRQGSAHRRFRVGHPAAGRAADDRDADDRRHGDGVLRATARGASRCRSSAKADRRSANGTRRSTSARRGGCRRSSASRTTRPRCRRRVAEQIGRARVRRQGGRLRHSGHHDRRHRSRRDRRGVRLGGRAGARRAGSDADRDWCRCACAATRTTTTCCISAAIRSRRGTTRRSPSTATPTASCTSTGPRAIRCPTYAARLEARRDHRGRAISSGSSARPRRSSSARRAR